jgi:DNA-binding XRE family transcriptional regulator
MPYKAYKYANLHIYDKEIMDKTITNFSNPIYAKTDDEILSELGGHIKQRRINFNLTQAEFAAAIGVSKDQLSKIERTGKTTLKTFIAVSRKLNLLQQLADIYQTPELTPIQKYEIEQKIGKIKNGRKRVKK